MTKPMIVVLSHDQLMAAELPGLFQGRAEIRACNSLDDLLGLSQEHQPAALVADFRRASNGGHQETRILESIHERHPQMRLAMVTPIACPETLERCAAITEITHLRGHLDRATLLTAFRGLFTDRDTSPPAVTSPSAPSTVVEYVDDEPLGVLTGISRRYETNSPHLKQMLFDLEVAARHDVTILLIGETGAGKTYLSRLIHEVSLRRHEPFLPVACGALPNDLIESELFGHAKGAFTSAHQDKEGKFLAARRGSILLDEIDVLGLEQQVKLLRVIETGEFEPVGSNHTQHCQARLIVASNLDLQPLVEQARFRPDLYYRLNMLKFVIPPLRHRKMDIIPLAKKFVRQFSMKHGVRIDEIDPGVFSSLLEYPWPGNVRELEHVVQRAVIYCRDGRLLASHLPQHILSGHAGPTNDPTVVLSHFEKTVPSPQQQPAQVDRTLGNQIAVNEKEIIEQTLFKNNFSRTKSARELGISRVTLYNKMKKYDLQD
ncbi:sigma-54 interaction domain-containing protein [Schlesneria paludicola]|uniref:sigma-54 interaction domain-containing protein n=1 Tax=Schlesneria paludicola TaxID=360056 RepID=UPI00029ABE1F|nr:sigma-54 dependent transcriptional regulator [Schlesneria paludicola]